MGRHMGVGVWACVGCVGVGGVYVWVGVGGCGCERVHPRSPEEGISSSSTFLIILELLL